MKTLLPVALVAVLIVGCESDDSRTKFHTQIHMETSGEIPPVTVTNSTAADQLLGAGGGGVESGLGGTSVGGLTGTGSVSGTAGIGVTTGVGGTVSIGGITGSGGAVGTGTNFGGSSLSGTGSGNASSLPLTTTSGAVGLSPFNSSSSTGIGTSLSMTNLSGVNTFTNNLRPDSTSQSPFFTNSFGPRP